MINWNKVTKKDSAKIHLIAQRAINEFGGNMLNCEMDIKAAHLHIPLDLDRLLTADRSNFGHDLFGIQEHLNRKTGEIENHFLPRYAKQCQDYLVMCKKCGQMIERDRTSNGSLARTPKRHSRTQTKGRWKGRKSWCPGGGV